jgi:hypothetical protein
MQFLERLDLEVDGDPFRQFGPHAPRLIHMTEIDAPAFINCPNRRCHAGGLNIAGLIVGAVADGRRELSDLYRCDGYERPTLARRFPCGNAFKVQARFQVAADPASSAP